MAKSLPGVDNSDVGKRTQSRPQQVILHLKESQRSGNATGYIPNAHAGSGQNVWARSFERSERMEVAENAGIPVPSLK